MDKTCKKVLQVLINSGKGTQYICAYDPAWVGLADISIEDMAQKLSIPTEDLRAATRFLKESGYLEYQTSRERVIGFHLSHKGLNWKNYRREEILKYIANKWTDFLAVVISLISLAISIIALLQEAK